jgi:hypothetical protein
VNPLTNPIYNAVFWDVTLCGSSMNRHSSETSVLTTAVRRNIPEDGILHSHRNENLKSYKFSLNYGFLTHRFSLPLIYFYKGPDEKRIIRFRFKKTPISGVLLYVEWRYIPANIKLVVPRIV